MQVESIAECSKGSILLSGPLVEPLKPLETFNLDAFL